MRSADEEGHRPNSDVQAPIGARPTMQLRAVDWLLAGSTVALGLALIAAPLAISSRLQPLYNLHGVTEEVSALSRWMMSRWLPPLMALCPVIVAVYCTVTSMRPRRRRVVLVVTLVVTLAAVVTFARGILTPLLSIASGRG